MGQHQTSSLEEDDFELDEAPRKPGARGHGFATLGAICLVAVLGLLATVPLDWKAQAVLGGILFAVALVVSRRSRGRRALVVLMVVSLFCTARYFWWRVSETSRYLTFNGSQTSPVDMIFIFLLLGAEAYGVVILVLGYFQGARPLRRKPAMLPDDIALWPAVDVFIPTFNEPLDVVRTTVLAALNMDWPRDRIKVYLLDDGKRSEVHTLAEECGAGYFARLDNVGAKAGNLNYGLARTNSEYVAIFDSDHIPTRSFLQMTVGGFLKDDRLALVQTPHHFYSADPFERNLKTFRKVPNENELFYGILQDGNDFWNAAFFCGSCAVLRRTALEEVGGVATDTVTEDSHTALRLQRLGWKTSYINIPLAAGLATANLADHIQQRIRWARGMIQILRIDNPLFGRGLTWKQRLCYFNSVIHFLHALPRLIFLTAPLVYLLLGRSNLYGYAWAVLAYVFPHLFLATLTSSRVHGRYRHSFWNEVFETVLAPYILLPTMLALINPRWGKFNVTPKRNVVKKAYFDLRIATPFLILLVLNFAGLGVAIRQLLYGVDDPGTVTVNLLWTMLNILILGATLAVPWEIHQWRSHVRVGMQIPIRLLLPDGGEVEGVTLDISTAGAAVQLDRPCGLNPGKRANLILRTPDAACVLPAHVRRTSGLRLGLKFVLTDMQQHEALIRLLFGRADSWIRWSAERQDENMLRSFGRLVLISLRGIVMIPKALFSGPGTEAEESAPAKQQPVLPSILLLLMALALPCQRVQAAEPFVETRDLATLGQQKPVTFRGGEGYLNLSFGVPATKLVQNAALNLSFRSSGGFQPDASRLIIALNGFQVASVPVQRKDGDSELAQQVQVALPPDLVVPDNRLVIQLSGHCVSGCKEAVEWLRVENATNIRLSGTMVPLVNTLRILPAPFFDASVHRTIRLPMIFAEDPDDQALQAAGVVASWFGVMADDRGARFAVRIGALLQGDAVLLTRKTSAIATELHLPETNGPAIAIRDNPSDPYGKLLVVAGSTSAEILAAAQALATGEYPKQGDVADVSSFRAPARSAPYDAPRWLNPERPTGLGDGLDPDQLHLHGSGSVKVYFRLPPDLSFGQRYTVPLHLNFAVTGGDSELGETRVFLNDVRAASKHFTMQAGPAIQRETIYLPVSALYPSNTLTLEFAFSPAKDGKLEHYPDVSVLPDSSIDLRGVPRFVRLPRLDLFVQAGFPFTRLKDLSETAVVLPDHARTEEIGVYLDLMARFGAQTGYPGLRVTTARASQVDRVAQKDLLLIGSPTDLPLISRWGAQMSVRLDKGGIRANQVSGIWGALIQPPFSSAGRERHRLNDLLEVSRAPDGVFEGFPSPLNRDRNAVLIATGDQQNWEALSDAESASDLSAVKGSVSILADGQFQSFAIDSDSTYLGKLSWREAFYNWTASNFYLIVLGVFACAVPLARWFDRWSEQHAQLRLEGGQ